MSYQQRRSMVRAAGSLVTPNLAGVHPLSVASPANAVLVANQAYFAPFSPPNSTTLLTMAFYCASGTNNHDLGIYDASGNRLTSRGTTATTAAAVNTWTLGTPLGLAAGTLYYSAFAISSATPTILTITPGALARHSRGMLMMSTAFALPSSATFANFASAAFPILTMTFT